MMKRVYWRPPGVSRSALTLIACVALTALVAVEAFPVQKKQHWYGDKMASARLALQAMDEIKAEKARLGIAPDAEGDPQNTGLIGKPLSSVTSDTGYLIAKRTSVNPNFAAVMVDLLKRAGVKPGDTVAVGVSGSFPALNIATYAALQTLKLKPIVIASASASQWGANDANLLWIDMERVLAERHLFSIRSAAASRGGLDDRGFGMSKEGRNLIDDAIARNHLDRLDVTSLPDAINKRMELYDEQAGDHPIRAYINVGGGTASVGTQIGKKQFKPGLNREPPHAAGLMDSVMLRFSKRGVPVIHVTSIEKIAEEYGLPVEPNGIPPVGQGTVYIKPEYNRWLALGGVALILAVMLAFIRLDVGLRILRGSRRKHFAKQPEQMI
jgi:poly-gamma-glutamate system protein